MKHSNRKTKRFPNFLPSVYRITFFGFVGVVIISCAGAAPLLLQTVAKTFGANLLSTAANNYSPKYGKDLEDLIYTIAGKVSDKDNEKNGDSQQYASNQGYQDQNYQNQGYQDQGYQNQGYQDQNYQNQTYQDQGYQNQGYQDQGYQNQAYQDQGYQNQGYQDQNYQNQGYQDQNYQNQGYQNQGYQDQNYQNQGYQNQAYQDQGYQDQNYQNQAYQDQGYQNQGYQDQNYQNQGYQDQNYQNQGYQDQNYQNQGYQNRPALPENNYPDNVANRPSQNNESSQTYPDNSGFAEQQQWQDAELAMSVDILVQRAGDDSQTIPTPIQDGDTLYSSPADPDQGDKIKISFNANCDCYVYVVGIDSTGYVAQIFPDPDSGHTNPVRRDNSYLIPEGNDWYGLDQYTGTEQVYFIASKNRRLDLERIISKLATQERVLGNDYQSVQEPAVIPKVRGMVKFTSKKTVPVKTTAGKSHKFTPTLFISTATNSDLAITRWFNHQ